MKISEWPEGDRPRERLRTHGPRSLSDAELLAVLIGSGTRGRDAVSMGREMIASAGSLARLMQTMPHSQATPGIGPAKAARIAAALEIARRVINGGVADRTFLRDPAASATYLRSRLVHLPYEVFACLFLDNRHRVLAFEELFRGTVDAAAVYPREVVRACLAHNASAVIFAHNHPSGVAEPSQADIAITHALSRALELVGVRVLDHLVIGEGEPVSMALRGLL
ncbi:RadC family protein [Pinirhizobacter sp.]|jgi:DNA repair protein RadC|uniref:RadC family protein n=1 Tax=Pinirhizobacter sp. TaxID=2950432 RepID=UPI002F412D6F